jgi:hypothetical protein
MNKDQIINALIEMAIFYADKSHWKSTHNGGRPSYRVISGDTDRKTDKLFGGRRARDVLHEIGFDTEFLDKKNKIYDEVLCK